MTLVLIIVRMANILISLHKNAKFVIYHARLVKFLLFPALLAQDYYFYKRVLAYKNVSQVISKINLPIFVTNALYLVLNAMDLKLIIA